MSGQLTLGEGRRVAAAIAEAFADTCVRLEVAGSVRREAPWVSDVDLVAIPERAFWSRVGTERAWRIQSKVLTPGKTRQVKLLWTEPAISVEIFLCTAETWGWIYMLRTGPETFCKRLVTVAPDLGFEFRGGSLTTKAAERGGGRTVATPEEADVFAALGLGEIPVAARSAQGIDDRLRHLRRQREEASR